MNIKIKIPSVQELYPVIRELYRFEFSSTLDITVEIDKIQDKNDILCVVPECNNDSVSLHEYTYSEPLFTH